MKVTLSVEVWITRLHFSQIIIDIKDVESSKKYVIVAEELDFGPKGGFVPIPEEFIDNFILSLRDFSTNWTQAVLMINWDFANQTNSTTNTTEFGVLIDEPIPRP